MCATKFNRMRLFETVLWLSLIMHFVNMCRVFAVVAFLWSMPANKDVAYLGETIASTILRQAQIESSLPLFKFVRCCEYFCVHA